MKLRDMDPEIRALAVPDGTTVRCLWFWHDGNPYCVPFDAAGPRVIPRPEPEGPFRIWKHAGGSTVDDLSLSPSFHVRHEDGRTLFHATLTNGAWS